MIAGSDADRARSDVTDAVNAFLADLQLGPGDEVFAAAARALGRKIDACSAAETGAAAQAVSRLSAELAEMLDRLLIPAVRKPDRVDQLVQRRTARRLALAAGRNADGHRVRPR